MRFALFREVPKRQRRKKRKLNNGAAVRKGSDGSDDGDSDDSDDEPAPAERMISPVASTSAAPVPLPQDPIWGDESQDVAMTMDEQTATAPSRPAHDSRVQPERFVAWIKILTPY
jgi:DNA replication licensing factor MCM3